MQKALIRWQDPNLGLVYPAQLVPIAEENGLIVPVGRWVLREACRQALACLDAGLPTVPVSVNISVLEFRHEGFLEGIALILKKTCLAPHDLELELTKASSCTTSNHRLRCLKRSRPWGCSLRLLKPELSEALPIGTLKTGQSFVRDIATDADDASIVSTVIGMGKHLKQRVIAEGVETQVQLALPQAACDERGRASTSAILCLPRTSHGFPTPPIRELRA